MYGLFDMQNTPTVFTNDSHPVDIYMVADKNLRIDTMFSHSDVSGFIYIQEKHLHKIFPPKKIPNFKDKGKSSVMAVCTCYSPTPVRIDLYILLSDCLRFASDDFHDLIASMDVYD